jgi:putative transposase
MPMKRYKPEQIVTLLRQIEVEIANGKAAPQACKEAEITVQTFYRWRKEFGGWKLDQAKLEKENSKLKRLVAELSLEKQVLKDIAEGNVWSASHLQAELCCRHSSVCSNVAGLSRVSRFWRPGHDENPRVPFPFTWCGLEEDQFPSPDLQYADQPLCPSASPAANLRKDHSQCHAGDER